MSEREEDFNLLWGDNPEEDYLERIVRNSHLVGAKDGNKSITESVGGSTLDSLVKNEKKHASRDLDIAKSVGGTAAGGSNKPTSPIPTQKKSAILTHTGEFHELLATTSSTKEVPEIIQVPGIIQFDETVEDFDSRYGTDMSSLAGSSGVRRAKEEELQIGLETSDLANEAHSPARKSRTPRTTPRTPTTEAFSNDVETTETDEKKEEAVRVSLCLTILRTATQNKVTRRLVGAAVFLFLVVCALVIVALLQVSHESEETTVDDSLDSSTIGSDFRFPVWSPSPEFQPAPSPFTILQVPSATPTTAVPPQESPVMTSPTGTSGPTVAVLLEVLQARILQISPNSRLSLGDQTSPQYQALEWLIADPFYVTYSNEKTIQRWVFATLFYSTRGAEWTRSDNWLSVVSECSWFSQQPGKVCDDDGKVVRIDLRNSGLAGTVPPELGLLSGSLSKSL
jgi:hypothetical protein